MITGCLGSAVAEVITKTIPVPLEYIGMPDKFGESGEPQQLLKKYGMSAEAMVEAAKKVMKRKSDLAK
jgi:transketolase